MKTLLRRTGLAAGVFFLLKGLVWLAVIAGATVWAGGDHAHSGRTHRTSAVAPRSGDERSGVIGGFSEVLPMGLGSAMHNAARACGQEDRPSAGARLSAGRGAPAPGACSR